MTEELARKYARWIEAERDGHDDDADAACRGVFSDTRLAPLPPVQFSAETMARIAVVKARDARRARRVRRAVVAAGVTGGPLAAYFGGAALISAASALMVGILDFIIQASVRFATASDWSVWSLVGNVGRALAAVMSDPNVTIAVLAMHGVAVAALIALQRLLGPEA